MFLGQAARPAGEITIPETCAVDRFCACKVRLAQKLYRGRRSMALSQGQGLGALVGSLPSPDF